MKKILIIFPFLPKYDVEFLARLSKISNFKIIVTADIKSENQLLIEPEMYSSRGFEVIHSDSMTLGPFIFTKRLRLLINRINPDLIIYNASPRDIGQFFSILLSKIRGRKIVAWSMFHRIGGPIIYSSLYYKFIGLFVDRNFCYSNTGKSYQLSRGIKEDKIDIIGTAIDEKKVFEHARIAEGRLIEALKDKFKLHEKKVLLQVVRLSKIKKPFVLLDLMELLLHKDPTFVLVLVGGGDLEAALKLEVQRRKLDSSIIFVGPEYDESKLSLWFSLAEIFIIPTCVGLSAHHAFCFGLPIITDNSKINQASEFDILRDNYNCLLYDEGNIEMFAEKILYLDSHEELYNKLSKNALDTVKNHHNLDAKVNNFIASVEKVFI